MYIYKITNTINNKAYVGQSINPIEKRFHRHINDALANRLDTHFARAIRKYGQENFILELIDTATSQEELNQKEHYWINYYNTVQEGYNETDSLLKCGGNTYLSKTPEEMKKIKEKIRQSKLGEKNPNATKVKCKNMITNEEYHFGSVSELEHFLQAPNHTAITRRCNRKIKCLYNGIWNIAYEQDEYNPEATAEKNNKRSTRVHVKNLETKEESDFISFAAAERFFNLPNKALSGKAYKHKDEKTFIVRQFYEITRLE